MVIHDYHVTMKRVGVADLKAKLSEYLRIARKGGEVVVMDRDQPVARLVPYAATQKLQVREPLRRYKNLGEIPLPPPANLDIDAVDLLIDDRRKERW
jgi:prevent-host-death family protein